MSEKEGAPRPLLARVRRRLRRERAAAEEEEGGGELNLVPYLDIVINTIIFLLATTASALPLAHINVSAPRESPPPPPTREIGGSDRLNLTVAVSYTGFIVAGSGGVLPGADGTGPTIDCTLPLRRGRCPAYRALRTRERGAREWRWIDGYDYQALTRLAEQIKDKYPRQRRVNVMADRTIPYRVVVHTMDALRGTPTRACTGEDGCLFDQVVLGTGVR